MTRGRPKPMTPEAIAGMIRASQHRHYYRLVGDGPVSGTVIKRCIHCPKTVTRRKEPV